MFLTELFEATDKRHASFCFGRMNPPTIGHGQLINTVANSAAGGDYFIFTSQTQDPKKNPLDYATKIKFLKALFPDHAGHVVQDPSLKTIIQVAHWLYAKGYRRVTFVAGSDRLADFKELLEKYNGVETANGYYQFDSINFASSGDRDPDAEGVTGVSASAARAAASAGNYEAFSQAVGEGKLSQQLYDAVRKGMNLQEGWWQDFKKGYKDAGERYSFYVIPNGINIMIKSLIKHGNPGHREWNMLIKKDIKDLPINVQNLLSNIIEDIDIELATWPRNWAGGITHTTDTNKIRRLISLYNQVKKIVQDNDPDPNKEIVEDAAGVGVVATNKKMARDPRYSTSMTVDVKPSTPQKNLKAFKLA